MNSVRQSAENAVFFIPEVEMGIPLAWAEIPRLVREIGPALTRELVMTCRRFTPAEMKQAGFMNRVVPASQLEGEVAGLVRDLLAKPSVPVAITKEHVNAITRVMGAGLTGFGDADALYAATRDEESRAAANAYRNRALKSD